MRWEKNCVLYRASCAKCHHSDLKTKRHHRLSHKSFGHNIVNSCSQGPFIRPCPCRPELLHFTSLDKLRDIFAWVCLTKDPCNAVQESTGVHAHCFTRALVWVLIRWWNVEYQNAALGKSTWNINHVPARFTHVITVIKSFLVGWLMCQYHSQWLNFYTKGLMKYHKFMCPKATWLITLGITLTFYILN